MGTPDAIEQVFVAGEDDAIFECPNNSLIDSLIYLIASYYVFDVSYPACYQGVMCFLQDLGLCHVDNSFRGSKFNIFLSGIRKQMLDL